jgi:hypothetical protein
MQFAVLEVGKFNILCPASPIPLTLSQTEKLISAFRCLLALSSWLHQLKESHSLLAYLCSYTITQIPKGTNWTANHHEEKGGINSYFRTPRWYWEDGAVVRATSASWILTKPILSSCWAHSWPASPASLVIIYGWETELGSMERGEKWHIPMPPGSVHTLLVPHSFSHAIVSLSSHC